MSEYGARMLWYCHNEQPGADAIGDQNIAVGQPRESQRLDGTQRLPRYAQWQTRGRPSVEGIDEERAAVWIGGEQAAIGEGKYMHGVDRVRRRRGPLHDKVTRGVFVLDARVRVVVDVQ